MYQIIEQTHDEKIRMYKKLSKKELAGMIIECNRLLGTIYESAKYEIEPDKIKTGEILWRGKPLTETQKEIVTKALQELDNNA